MDSFSASDVSFREVINAPNVNYRIPRFQRSYSWTKDNAEDFLTDLESGGNDSFFVGSIVLNVDGESTGYVEIVDGQQRMITSSLLLAAIRDIYHDNKIQKSALEIQEDFIGAERRGKWSWRITPSDQLKDFFKEFIQIYPKKEFPSKRSINAEKNRIVDNYNIFYERLSKKIDTFESNEDKSTALRNIEDMLLDMRVIRIRVKDESRAYEIFETINARGVDLTAADLLKNTIFSKVGLTDDGYDVAKERWGRILENLEGTPIDMTTFVRYHWLSKYSFVTKKGLYRSIKTTITDWEGFLNELYFDSCIVNGLCSSDVSEIENVEINHRVAREINRSLTGINAVGTRQSFVLLLAIIRDMDSTGFKRVHKIFQSIENFTFYYHGICNGPANRVEKYWNRRCQDLQDIINTTEVKEKISKGTSWTNSLKDYLNSLLNEELYIEKFEKSLRYKNSQKARSIITYFLSKLNRHHNKEGIDPTSISIEHILPNQPKEWGLTKSDVKDYVHKIGNLTLINPDINGGMGNKPLSDKIPEFRKSGIHLNKVVLDKIRFEVRIFENDEGVSEEREVPVWDQEIINQRTNELCEESLEIWKIK